MPACFRWWWDRDQPATHIAGLEAADAGDHRALIRLCAEIETQALLRAVSLAEDTIQAASGLAAAVHGVVDAARRPRRTQWRRRRTAPPLADTVELRLQQIRDGLNAASPEAKVPLQASACRAWAADAHDYLAQLTQIANERFSHCVNLPAPRQWVHLHVRNGIRADLIFALHSIEHRVLGAMASLSFTKVRHERQAQVPAEWSAEPMCVEPFTFCSVQEVCGREVSLAWVSGILPIC